MLTPSTALTALALLTITTPAFAQTSNSTNSTDPQCPPHPRFNLDSPVNSSATVPIPHSNTSSSPAPWYLTVTLNDTRSASSVDTSFWGFLSSPPNATGETCVFLLKGDLLDAQSGANGDCAGSLSADCVDAIRRSMEFSGGEARGGQCPNTPSLQTVQGACGSAFGQGWQGMFFSVLPSFLSSPLPFLFFSRIFVSLFAPSPLLIASTTHVSSGASTGPIDAANLTCKDDRVPGAQQPPDGYTSTALFGISGFSDDESDRSDPSKFTWYDRYASRPYPWVVAHRGENGESWTSVVCVTPGEIDEGSRDPDTSGADRRGVAWGIVGVMGVAALMGML